VCDRQKSKILLFLRGELNGLLSLVGQGSRPDVRHVAVLITDRPALDSEAAIREACDDQNAGIELYTIGLRRSNVTELRQISSLPREEYRQWWALDEFTSKTLSDIEFMLNNEICRPELGRFYSVLFYSTPRPKKRPPPQTRHNNSMNRE